MAPETENEPLPANDGMVCPECGTKNGPTDSFCIECGVKLVRRPVPAGRRKRRGSGDELERARARKEFARAKQIVFYLRSTFWGVASISIMTLAFWHLMLSRTPEADLAEVQWLVTLVTIVLWGELAVFVAGGLFVLRAPMIWAVVAACWYSVNSVLVLYGNPAVVQIIARGVALLVIWSAVGSAGRVQRLQREHPDLQLQRKRIDRDRRVEGGVADQARDRRRKKSGQEWRGRLRVLGIVAAVALVTVPSVWWLTRPPSLESVAEKFVQTWRQGDDSTMAAMFEREITMRGMQREMVRRGWDAAPPELGEPELVERERFATATFAIDGGAGSGAVIEASFVRDDDLGWAVQRVKLPAVETPELEPAIERFEKAWHGGGLDVLVGLFREDAQARIRSSIETILDKREWLDTRPMLHEHRIRDRGDDYVVVEFDLMGKGVIVIRFDYWHPDWVVGRFRVDD